MVPIVNGYCMDIYTDFKLESVNLSPYGLGTGTCEENMALLESCCYWRRKDVRGDLHSLALLCLCQWASEVYGSPDVIEWCLGHSKAVLQHFFLVNQCIGKGVSCVLIALHYPHRAIVFDSIGYCCALLCYSCQ